MTHQANPYPDDAAIGARRDERHEEWELISPERYDEICALAFAEGGHGDLNAFGSAFIYLGTREVAGGTTPRLVATKNNRTDPPIYRADLARFDSPTPARTA